MLPQIRVKGLLLVCYLILEYIYLLNSMFVHFVREPLKLLHSHL